MGVLRDCDDDDVDIVTGRQLLRRGDHRRDAVALGESAASFEVSSGEHSDLVVTHVPQGLQVEVRNESGAHDSEAHGRRCTDSAHERAFIASANSSVLTKVAGSLTWSIRPIETKTSCRELYWSKVVPSSLFA